ncbi:anaphase-promoting complex subunit 15-like [Mercenaria mercenaria]|uniref:anaphase-promoting complex subunit 15-like n=1 Tax=Mercenaria mercenaria TaxID=6596 RepID=UPI001E1DC133|nr:anaphase-promoting complex subunit 15-like [Mercenaria mercenaria]
MAAPIFPKLIPSATDRLWFAVDKPCDDENELSELEDEYQSWVDSISKKDEHIVPIGKTASEHFDEEEDEDDDDGEDDDDESDTNDDELDTDMIDDRDSPEEVDMEANGIALT